MRIRFANASLLEPRTGVLREDMHVLVVGDTIAEVSERPITGNADQDFDLHGAVLSPGFIDCHVHVIASQYNLGNNAKMPNVFAALRAVSIMRGMLNRGFTTVRDAGGADWSFAQASAGWDIEAPRIYASGKALSQTGGHGDGRQRNDLIEPCACSFKIGSLARVVDGVDACRLAVREEIQKGAAQIKIMASGGVASPVDPVHFLGYSKDEIRAIVEEAANADTYVMAHAYTGAAIARAVECGVRSIEHGNLVDEDAARVMAREGAIAVPTLVTYEALAIEGERLGLPPESVAKIARVREGGLRSLEIFRDAGVRMAFGTDLLGESHRMQSDEFRMRADVLGNAAAIRSATIDAAVLLREEGRLGEIVPGALADLLIIDGNPFADISCLLGQGERMRAVMKGGRFFRNCLQ